MTLAGDGTPGSRDHAEGIEATFDSPLGLFVDSAKDIFVADTGNNLIRKVSPFSDHSVATVAGMGEPGYVDGPAEEAKFNFPNDLVVDQEGNLFVTEFNNHTVRKITPGGEVSIFVGNGVAGDRDGQGQSARLSRPAGIALGPSGNLYVTEWDNHKICRITPEKEVTTLAGSGEAGLKDGEGSQAQFNEPDGIAVGPEGNLFVSEHGNNAVRLVRPDGSVITIASGPEAGFTDANPTISGFDGPGGIGVN